MMEDAIDDWLLRQIQLLRRDDIIAQGIRWVQDVRTDPCFLDHLYLIEIAYLATRDVS